MIIYCGIEHFYINHFPQSPSTKPLVLINQNQVIDFSPSLRSLGINLATPLKNIKQIYSKVKIEPINLANFYDCNRDILQFCQQWTDQIEIEAPHACYCKLPEHFPSDEFGQKFLSFLNSRNLSGFWGAASSKLIAKLAAYFRPNQLIVDEQSFLKNLPISYLQLPETEQLNKLGIYYLGELAALPVRELTYQFGLRAEALKKLAAGQDLEPFTPEQLVNISWEMDFTTTPETTSPVGYRQLNLFLQRAADHIAQQLKNKQLLVKSITLSWKAKGKQYQIERYFKKSTNQPKNIYQNVRLLLPNYPVEKLKLVCAQVENAQPEQLNILSENLTKQKIAALKAELGEQLIELKLTRREKIMEMWEMSYL